MRNPYATNIPMSKAGTYDPSVKDDELGAGLVGGNLDFSSLKKGKLKDMLGRPDDYKFSKEELEKINVAEGKSFDYNGKKRKMTKLLKKRIQFAINFMK